LGPPLFRAGVLTVGLRTFRCLLSGKFYADGVFRKASSPGSSRRHFLGCPLKIRCRTLVPKLFPANSASRGISNCDRRFQASKKCRQMANCPIPVRLRPGLLVIVREYNKLPPRISMEEGDSSGSAARAFNAKKNKNASGSLSDRPDPDFWMCASCPGISSTLKKPFRVRLKVFNIKSARISSGQEAHILRCNPLLYAIAMPLAYAFARF
jgi:hypothetical protein